jgi:hypothetical protein
MKYSVFLIAFVIPILVFAQKNFRPGYIVHLKGDTSSGFIDYKEWDFSPIHILFKLSNNANAQEYGVNDLSFFNVTGNESYRRSIVKISLHPAKLNDLGVRDTSWKIDTVFLKVIYAGKLVSLLSYTDKIKDRFYILEEGQQQPTELMIREYLREDAGSVASEKEYRNQLKNLLRTKGIDNDKLAGRIEESAYDEYDLKKIIALINRTVNAEEAEEKKIRKLFWFAGLGLHRDKIEFRGDHQLARNTSDNHSPLLPVISAGFDLFSNPNVGKLFYRVEIGVLLNKSSTTSTLPNDVKAIYSLSGFTLSLQPQLNYTIYNSAKLKIPLGIGVVYNQMNYSKNQYKKVYPDGSENNHVEDWLDLRKSITTFFARAAVVFNNKIEASFLYRPSLKLTKTVIYDMSRTNNIQLEFYYLFRNK